MGTHLSLTSLLGETGPFPEIDRSQTISPLLALPRELRDEIIDYVLQSPMSPPQPPPFALRHPPKESDSDVYYGSHKGSKITLQPHSLTVQPVYSSHATNFEQKPCKGWNQGFTHPTS